ncbi:YuzD family protein [Oceanobacillus senegalensis]|uniref:YuzD family protein n=1 Tax=Oceanobacillus senegalensis TaxID=1936063 RepID=UPI000A30E0C9|nr:YuzD family protein [Oceanobacillus senegalensis]
MNEKKITITVYGAEQICASCVGAPGSVDTYEWIQAAISRKYGQKPYINYKYVDINQPPNEKKHQEFIKRIVDEDLFWPIILINDEIIAEGIPRLKSVYKALEKHGVEPS